MQIGLRSITIVLLTAVFSSMVITVQFALQLARFGAKEWVGSVVGVTLARELGPVMTALMVGGRVGAGIAAELGSMAVTEQIDAMRALGADPVQASWSFRACWRRCRAAADDHDRGRARRRRRRG